MAMMRDVFLAGKHDVYLGGELGFSSCSHFPKNDELGEVKEKVGVSLERVDDDGVDRIVVLKLLGPIP